MFFPESEWTVRPLRERVRTLRRRIPALLSPPFRRAAAAFLLGAAAAAVPAAALAPLGVGYTAAHLSDRRLPFAALGAIAGYAISGGRSGLLFGGAALCLLAAGVILSGRKVELSQPVRMAAAASAALAVGLGDLLAAPDLAGAVLLNARVLLAGGSALIFEAALGIAREAPPVRETARLLLCGVLLSLLSRVPLPFGADLGGLAGAAIVWYLAAGDRKAAKAGLLLGAVVDLAAGTAPCFSVVWALAGLCGRLFRPLGLPGASLCFLLAGSFSALWCAPYPAAITAEICLAGAAGALLPRGVKARLARKSPSLSRRRRIARGLEEKAAAFERLERETEQSEPRRGEWLRPMLRETREEICGGCERRAQCLLPTAERLGTLLCRCAPAGELPEETAADLRRDCPRADRLRETLSRRLALRLYSERLRGSMERSREILCAQYGDFARILRAEAAEARRELCEEKETAARAERAFREKGLSVRVSAWRDENGRGWIEAEGRGAARIPPAEERWRRILSGISGGPVETAEICRADGETRVTFRERDRMELEMEAQSGRAAGGPACGDCTAYLRLRSGERFLLLSDGMGHGEAAAEEARRALSLLQTDLRSGMDPELALRTVTSALLLRTQGTDFATIDMFRVDPFGGRAVFYKCGAAPTWLCRGGRVEKLPGAGMPAGAALCAPVVERRTLAPGDWVVILSDGVADGEEDAWIGRTLARMAGGTAEEMVRAILSGRPDRRDDGTAVAVRIRENPEPSGL